MDPMSLLVTRKAVADDIRRQIDPAGANEPNCTTPGGPIRPRPAAFSRVSRTTRITCHRVVRWIGGLVRWIGTVPLVRRMGMAPVVRWIGMARFRKAGAAAPGVVSESRGD